MPGKKKKEWYKTLNERKYGTKILYYSKLTFHYKVHGQTITSRDWSSSKDDKEQSHKILFSWTLPKKSIREKASDHQITRDIDKRMGIRHSIYNYL